MSLINPKGEPVGTPAPLNPLKIGRIVHACDPQQVCAPMLLAIIHDPGQEVVGGHVFANRVVTMAGMRHVKRPDLPPDIVTPGEPTATWHWPGECPWGR